MENWLEEFMEYASHGEASQRTLFWVGVSTIAGALRRKVWFNMGEFEYAPNFYILIVGAPGSVKKTSSINVGKKLLKQVPGINFGPDICTWQALIEYIAQAREDVILADGEVFEMSCVTLAIGEFGGFFDPEDRQLIDNLTSLWDSNRDTIDKRTKTSGNDSMVNPWINLISATTPKWIKQNFGEHLVGSGFASRVIFVYEDMPTKDVAYPIFHMGDMSARKAKQNELIEELTKISKYSGDFRMATEAIEFGDAWYIEHRNTLRACDPDSLESSFIQRNPDHFNKLAQIFCASRFGFPLMLVEDFQKAAECMKTLAFDKEKILGSIGLNKITAATREIVNTINKVMGMEKPKLYELKFKNLTYDEYEVAVRSAVKSGQILEQISGTKLFLMKR